MLENAVVGNENIDEVSYSKFRSGILKHIGMEEKILIPEYLKTPDTERYSLATHLRLDHGAIAALLVPKPSLKIIAALKAILSKHNVLEEKPGGLYEVCEQSVGDNLDLLMTRIQNVPEVPVNPYNLNPAVFDSTRRALARAGYNFDEFENND
ncbi:MAG: hemerythrin domain-containing protein [Ignavibacteriales bacterium]|nr:hemerythrin domain-containing protein [Ignavibacteriales bacterium]